MGFTLKPDYDEVKKRYDAFWEGEIVDRALVCLPIEKAQKVSVPKKEYATLGERWLDVDFRAEQRAAELQNTEYLGDSLPIAWPNMGPEIFSAWCGCGYNYGESTTWSDPCIDSWDSDADSAVFDPEHKLFKLTDRFTDNLLDLSNGDFIVGLTDFHPGGDHIAALRDPANLAMDMIENVELVEKKLTSSYPEYFKAYNYFYEKLKKADMPITSWCALIADGRYYIPSNDFSCMISEDMFQRVFLPGVIEECDFYDRSIYHLDGPGALRHLDALLDIEALDAVQWVPGAGNEGFSKWTDVYKKIQAAGKGIQITGLEVADLPMLFDQLKPEGVYISGIIGVNDQETAGRVLNQITAWK